MSGYRIEPLREGDPQSGFECSESQITEFFRNEAWSHARKGFGCTYVAHADPPGSAPVEIVGFYTIAMSRVTFKELSEELRSDLPPYPVPVALLGQLARDRRAPVALKLGEALMLDALERILDIADQIGCAGVILDALNEKLVGYYGKFGFVSLPLKKSPQKMFLPIQRARAAREQGRSAGLNTSRV